VYPPLVRGFNPSKLNQIQLILFLFQGIEFDEAAEEEERKRNLLR
jgi:hypothetical protein